ncbi:hypothetical protein CK503_08875 [Aliifodinibius salipaludis]|uniref:Uncharacterized protein n=1 Tax=Fodinibius salipaludis TaxID=2032627 RepID=A0A2A2GAA2_9BACT|nr:hypothetical protein [Aliifodinibius salipaludis]PAU93777.1 hypothetical protein CK503_08875 [Aliifodinibius salipaludis]
MDTKSKKREVWGFRISIIAIIISLLSVGINYWTYYESQMDQLKVKLESTGMSDVPVVLEHHESLPSLNPLEDYIVCQFTNIGNRPISITDFFLTELKNGEEYGFGLMNLGLYNDNFEEISLPINLDVGESTKRYLRITLDIDSTSYAILRENFEVGKTYSKSKVVEYLAKENGIDIYGNEVKYSKIGNGYSINKGIIGQGKSQTVIAYFKTGRGYLFEDKYRTKNF